MMYIAPSKSAKLKVTCICLEHGKPDPNPKMRYKLIPLDMFTTDSSVQELCGMLGRGEVGQSVAQAAAWHLMDGLSWEVLATKNRVESEFTGNIRYFTPAQILGAVHLVAALHASSDDASDFSQQSDAGYNGGNRE